MAPEMHIKSTYSGNFSSLPMFLSLSTYLFMTFASVLQTMNIFEYPYSVASRSDEQRNNLISELMLTVDIREDRSLFT